MTVYLKAAAASTVNVPTTTETAVLVTPAPQYAHGGDNGAVVSGNVILTAGTAATAATVRVRQGNGITGTVIGPAQALPVTAGATSALPVQVWDPSPPSPIVYTVTVQQTAATGNGTVVYVAAGAEEITES